MNCIIWDEKKGFNLIPRTNNCEDKNKVYEYTSPILKDGKYLLDYYNEEEYKKICNISIVICDY